MFFLLTCALIITLSMLTGSGLSADVLPTIGGGQVGMASAPMKHLDVGFDGIAIDVHVDDSFGPPLLRPLPLGSEFGASAPWVVLQDKAYNFQYGWNAAGFISLPFGTGIWIEQVRATPGLEVYSRPPATPAWSPIFGTDGSAPRWKWSGAMTHNAYAVLDPVLPQYTAEYRVYVGDAATGNPLGQYVSESVTLTFMADPVRLPGDFDGDGHLSASDLDLLAMAISSSPAELTFDLTGDAAVEADDYRFWVENLKQTWLGDANLDGEFNSDDLIQVFQAGKYETGEHAGWAEGDWSADRQFSSSDLVAAFDDGGFERGPRTHLAAVPEPASGRLIAFALISLTVGGRRR